VSSVTDECRKTWRELGVRRAVIEELTAELGADLADAEADGISAEAFVGHDAKALARQWATERGLARARLRVPLTAVVAVLGAIPGASFGLFAAYGLSNSALSVPQFTTWMILIFYSLAGGFAAVGTILAVRTVLSWQADLALKQTTQLFVWTTLPVMGLAVIAAMSFANYREYASDRVTLIGDAAVPALVYGVLLGVVRAFAVLQSRGDSDGGYEATPLVSSVSR